MLNTTILNLETDRPGTLEVQQMIVAHHNSEPATSVNHGRRHFKSSVIVFQSQRVHRILVLYLHTYKRICNRDKNQYNNNTRVLDPRTLASDEQNIDHAVAVNTISSRPLNKSMSHKIIPGPCFAQH